MDKNENALASTQGQCSPADAGEQDDLPQRLTKLTDELHEVERQRNVFIQQRDDFEAETKRLYKILAEKDSEIHEVERQRGVFMKQRDDFEAETKKLYAGHSSMEEEINFWRFRHDETSALHERVVEQKWCGEHPYGDYCCSFPFERIEILPRGEVYTCCSGHLKSGYSIGNIYTDDFDEMWNCDKVKKLRYSVTMGDFEYCHDYCMWLANRDRLEGEDATHPVRKKEGSISFSNWKTCTISHLPKYITLGCDETCNLQCPSCRTSKRFLNKEQSKRVEEMLINKVRPLLGNCRQLEMLSTGEVFASMACCNFLKTLSAEEFPQLKLSFITNAQLFTRTLWNDFFNLHKIPIILYISMDAALKETYEAIRFGAKWEILCENAKFISQLRKNGNIERLTLNFVVQKQNYREMETFVELGRKWGADAVRFQYLTNWGTLSTEQYKEDNVFYPENSAFQEAVNTLERLTSQVTDIKVLENILEIV
ncbi:SPASM domain-containing protein [Butyricicoccus faecihominis]|uniref:SPASM domain-containing protein n=1 Tax=Butyricicoccus faecihominis TaxID=1712515 RepID=UPI002478D243|nr:SPASM domain-containing protein [Butyricicoccus faecihominis]MCQ5131142.1 SPASM domain-containing protein [Butyricicoccus faecihominis]